MQGLVQLPGKRLCCYKNEFHPLSPGLVSYALDCPQVSFCSGVRQGQGLCQGGGTILLGFHDWESNKSHFFINHLVCRVLL